MTENITETPTSPEATDDQGVDPAVPVGQDQPAPEVEVEPEPDTFPRAYVEQLRSEAAEARVKVKRTDTLAGALWTAQVAATGRLADPTDLPMPTGADPLDTDAITTAVDDLLTRKPHLASRRPIGEIGQGATGSTDTVDLAGILRSRT